jgi:hypothetical protein
VNLNAVVAPYTAAVAPQQPATVYLSTGQSPTAPDGSRAPLYADPFNVTLAVQPVSTGDLRKLEGLNIQGVSEKLYLNGQLRGLQRINQLGGDLVVLRDGTTYLVKAVLEAWRFVSAGNGWSCVAVVLQNDAKVSFIERPRL